MNAKLYVLLVCLTGCLVSCRICAAADESGGYEALEQAWQMLGHHPSSVPAALMLGRKDVDAFLSNGETQVVAVCDPFQSKCDAARDRVESHYARASGATTSTSSTASATGAIRWPPWRPATRRPP